MKAAALRMLLATTILTCRPCPATAQLRTACDIDAAADICRALPLSPVEGIWVYPDDNVTVMVIEDSKSESYALPSYTITALESSDCRISPGDTIGRIEATPKPDTFTITLFTERKGNLLGNPAECTAVLSKDSETLIMKKEKGKFRLRLGLNLNRLLPGFWKIVRVSASSSGDSKEGKTPVGMVKIFPSYDGDGSSARKPRYL